MPKIANRTDLADGSRQVVEVLYVPVSLIPLDDIVGFECYLFGAVMPQFILALGELGERPHSNSEYFG